jgi:hypothetical protein
MIIMDKIVLSAEKRHRLRSKYCKGLKAWKLEQRAKQK